MRRKTTMHKSFKPGDVVLIKANNKNRGEWNMGILTKTFRGNDGEIRDLELQARIDKSERAIHHFSL